MSARVAIAITITAAGLLLVAARRSSSGPIEAADDDYVGAIDPGAIVDRVETFINVITEGSANVDTTTASKNINAFLRVIRQAEGTDGQADAYRVCYAYRHTIANLADHPAVTGEWRGELLSATMCINAGLKAGCKSTAAGAYQIIRPTWLGLKASLGLVDFTPQSQDAAAVELVRRRGALQNVMAGEFSDAVDKCRNEWASLPGNHAKQGQRSIETLAAWFSQAGGTFA
jgi:muramidase (phage lysozyme)